MPAAKASARESSSPDAASGANPLKDREPYIPSLSSGLLLRLAMLLGALAYLRTISFSFVLDDFGIIVINPWLESWRFVPRFFTDHVWSSLGWSTGGSYYRPLFLLWLSLNRHLFALTPAWWHLSVVAAHLACSYLVYLLAQRILQHRDTHSSDVTAALAALLFAVHPVHVEAVAWIAGSSELLLAITFLGSFIFYLDWQDDDGHNRRLALALSLAAYGLALLAKETAIALPVLVFAHSWILAQGTGRKAFATSTARITNALSAVLPYLLLTAVYAALRVFVLRAATSQGTAPLRSVLLTIPSAALFYLQHLLWPFRLSYLYDFDLVTHPSLGNFGWPLLAVAVVGLALWRIFRRSPLAQFLACWTALLIAPAIAALLVFSRHDYVHDRYLYLPSAGFCILLATLLKNARLPQLQTSRTATKAWVQPAVIVALALAAVITVSTFRQAAYWDNDISLLTWASHRAPRNPLPRQLLAESFFAAGETDAALDSYRRALALDPDSSLVNWRIAMAYLRAGKLPEVEQHLARAIELRRSKGLRDNAEEFYYLGLVHLQNGNLTSAEPLLRHAIQLDPKALSYHSALASLLARKGDLVGAQAESRAELSSRSAYNAATQRLLKP